MRRARGGGAETTDPNTPPTMFPHVITKATEDRFGAAALAFACLFAATLPFHHLLAVRMAALGLAALFTFVAGGWREILLLPLRAAWGAWTILAVVSVAFAHDPRTSVGEFRHEIVYAFGAWATWYALARRRDGARWLGRTLAVATIVALAIAAAVFVPGQPWLDLGQFGDVGSLSTYLVTVLPVFLLLALRSPQRSAARVAALALSAGCLVAGSLTLNRTFWLAAAVEITIFAIFSMRYWNTHRRVPWMLFVAAVVAALAAIQLLLTSESRIALAAPGAGLVEFIAEDPRGGLWHFAAAQIAEHPWIGDGLGKWSSRDAFVARFNDVLLMHAHNVFLNRALETGLPGLVAFVALLAAVAIAFLRVARSVEADTAAIGAAGLALVAGVITKNLTDDFFVRQNALLFWSLAGAGLGAAGARAASTRAVAPP